MALVEQLQQQEDMKFPEVINTSIILMIVKKDGRIVLKKC